MMRKYQFVLFVVLAVILVGCNGNNDKEGKIITELTLPFGADQPLWYSKDITGYDFVDQDLNPYEEKVSTFISGTHSVEMSFHTSDEQRDHNVVVTVLERDNDIPLLFFYTSRYVVLGTRDSLVDNMIGCQDLQGSCTIKEIENTVEYGTPGEYFVRYQATDDEGNKSEVRTLYVIISNNKSVLSYGESNILDLQETENSVNYLMQIHQPNSTPIYFQDGTTLYVVTYENNLKTFTHLDNIPDNLGNECMLYMDTEISLFCTVELDNEQKQMVRYDFTLDGEYIDQGIVGTMSIHVFPSITFNGLLYYNDNSSSYLELTIYDCNTDTSSTTIIGETEDSYRPLFYTDTPLSIGSSIYLLFYKEAETIGMDLVFVEYNTETSSSTEYRLEGEHVSFVYNTVLLNPLVFIIELSNESVETRYRATLGDGEININEPYDTPQGNPIVFNNEVYFYSNEYGTCPGSDIVNCSTSYLYKEDGTVIEVPGTYFWFASSFHNMERSTYIGITKNRMELVIQFDINDFLIE